MNPDDHDPELDPTLRATLDQHARTGGRPSSDINAVWARVEHRRRRRRSVAVFGSLAIVGAGVVGIAGLAASGDDGQQMAAGGVDSSSAFASTTVEFGQSLWACTGPLGSSEQGDMYASCVPVTYPNPDPGFFPCQTPVLATAPPTTAPATSSPTTTATTIAGPPDTTCVVPNPELCVVPGTSVPMTIVITVPVTTAPVTWVDQPSYDCTIYDPYVTATTYEIEGTYPPPTTTGATVATEQAYTVRTGDSINSIAAIFAIDVQTLVNYNQWQDGPDHPLLVDEVVLIPPGALVP